MTPGELVDAALRAYRALGWPLLEACLLPSIFGLAGLTFLTDIVLPDMFSTSNPESMQVQFSEVVVAMLLGLAVASPLLLIGAAYVSALSVFLVADFMVGNVPNLKNAQAAAHRLFRKTFLFIFRQTVYASAGIVLGVLVLMLSAWINSISPPAEGNPLPAIAGLVAIGAFLVGGIMFFIVVGWDCLAIPAMIYEGLSTKQAIARGRDLLKSGRGVPNGGSHVFVVWCFIVFMLLFLLMGVGSLYGIVTSLVGADANPSKLAETLMGLVPSFFVVWLLLPVWGVCTTILYFERRVRKEAFDVDLLAQDVWSSQKNARFVL